MSELTKLLNRSTSGTTDAVLSIVIGGVGGLALGLFPLPLPFWDQFAMAGGGVIGAAIYLRQRNNLRKSPPTFE